MSKFKVGDRVRLIGTHMAAKVGATATVTLADDGDLILIRWDRDELAGTQADGGYFDDAFELLPVAAQQAGPVRTVTRREIVPGEYGKLEIFADASAIMSDWTDPVACREAARIFNEIADVLEEQVGEAG